MNDKITFVTGAGASFGCGAVTPYNPPLGKDLYNNLELRAPEVMNQIYGVIGRKNTTNFEAKMNEILESKRIKGFEFNSFLAKYFSMFRPSFLDNRFVELFRILYQNQPLDFIYSTLNYDCIAELAASSVGFKINYDIDNLFSDSFNIFKIHDSCNFINDSMQGCGKISSALMRGTVD